MKKPSISPTLALFLLAPAIGELLSGSSPPKEFFSPIPFLILTSLYGSGAILIHELKTRWKKDYHSLLLLGAAYGILEEGLIVKSFFDPKWMDIGILGTYGRWLETNWIWTEGLTIYHAVFSTTIPIILIELAYPHTKTQPWTSKRTFTALTILLAFVTVIGLLFLTSYRPPPLQYIATIIAMILFGYAAYKLPTRNPKPQNTKQTGPRRMWLTGFLATITFFFLFYAGPYLISQPFILTILIAVVTFGTIAFLSRYEWNGKNLNRLAISSGALSFLILFAFLMGLSSLTAGFPSGMMTVAVIAASALLLLRRKVKKQTVQVNAYIPA